MTGLRRVLPNKVRTQPFDGDFDREPPGFFVRDALGARRARKRAFPDSIGRDHFHGAVDIKCDRGTVIKAPERGRIVRARDFVLKDGRHERYLMLQIRPGTVLFFTHLKKHLVPEGCEVERGAPIALSGNSGNSTGPHLHYEVRVTRRADPHPGKSSRWFKLDPERLEVGGDMAGHPAIQPLPPNPALACPDPEVALATARGQGTVTDDDFGDLDLPAAPLPSAVAAGDFEADDDLEEDLDPDDELGDPALSREIEDGVALPGD